MHYIHYLIYKIHKFFLNLSQPHDNILMKTDVHRHRKRGVWN